MARRGVKPRTGSTGNSRWGWIDSNFWIDSTPAKINLANRFGNTVVFVKVNSPAIARKKAVKLVKHINPVVGKAVRIVGTRKMSKSWIRVVLRVPRARGLDSGGHPIGRKHKRHGRRIV